LKRKIKEKSDSSVIWLVPTHLLACSDSRVGEIESTTVGEQKMVGILQFTTVMIV
jgi:hypothetical protein